MCNNFNRMLKRNVTLVWILYSVFTSGDELLSVPGHPDRVHPATSDANLSQRVGKRLFENIPDLFLRFLS